MTKIPTYFYFSSLLVILCSPLSHAWAQSENGPAPEKDLTFMVGALGLYAPAFQGSEDYTFSALPNLGLKYKDRFFASFSEGLGYNVITRGRDENGWKIGPLVKYNGGRSEDGDSFFTLSGDTDALRGMGDVDGAPELGGFIDYQHDVLQARLEARHAIGGHDGMLAEGKINYVKRFGPVMLGAGPTLTWSSSEYNQAFFGVDGVQSKNTKLSQYTPESGVSSYGVGSFAMMPMGESFAVMAFAKYDRLGSVVTDSSFIEKRGTENQTSIGLGVTYRFGYDW